MQQRKVLKLATGHHRHAIMPVRSRDTEFKNVKSPDTQPAPRNPAKQKP